MAILQYSPVQAYISPELVKQVQGSVNPLGSVLSGLGKLALDADKTVQDRITDEWQRYQNRQAYVKDVADFAGVKWRTENPEEYARIMNQAFSGPEGYQKSQADMAQYGLPPAVLDSFMTAAGTQLKTGDTSRKDAAEVRKNEAAIRQSDAAARASDATAEKTNFDLTRLKEFDNAAKTQGLKAFQTTPYGLSQLILHGPNATAFMDWSRKEQARQSLEQKMQEASAQNKPLDINSLSADEKDAYRIMQENELKGRTAQTENEQQQGHLNFLQFISNLKRSATDDPTLNQWREQMQLAQLYALQRDPTSIQKVYRNLYEKYKQQFNDKEGRYLSEPQFMTALQKEIDLEGTPQTTVDASLTSLESGIKELQGNLRYAAINGLPMTDLITMVENPDAAQKAIDARIEQIVGNDKTKQNNLRQNIDFIASEKVGKENLNTPEAIIAKYTALNSIQNDRNLIKVWGLRNLWDGTQSLSPDESVVLKNFQNRAATAIDLFNRNSNFYKIITKLLPESEIKQLKDSIKIVSKMVPGLTGNKSLPAYLVENTFNTKLMELENSAVFQKGLRDEERAYIRAVIDRLKGLTKTIGMSAPFDYGPAIDNSSPKPSATSNENLLETFSKLSQGK